MEGVGRLAAYACGWREVEGTSDRGLMQIMDGDEEEARSDLPLGYNPWALGPVESHGHMTLCGVGCIGGVARYQLQADINKGPYDV